MVLFANGGASLAWSVQPRDHDRPFRPLLHAIFFPYRVFKALTMCALHLIAEISYLVSF